MRIAFDEENLIKLLTGKEVDIDGVKMILSDIGWDRILSAVHTAMYESITTNSMKNLKTFEQLNEEAQYWGRPVGDNDDFGDQITDEFIDGKSRMGPWGIMTPKSWKTNGVGRLGTGYGQRYKKQADGKWLKVDG